MIRRPPLAPRLALASALVVGFACPAFAGKLCRKTERVLLVPAEAPAQRVLVEQPVRETRTIEREVIREVYREAPAAAREVENRDLDMENSLRSLARTPAPSGQNSQRSLGSTVERAAPAPVVERYVIREVAAPTTRVVVREVAPVERVVVREVPTTRAILVERAPRHHCFLGCKH